MIKKILTTLGGLALAGVIVAGGFYAFNKDFRTDVNKNVFGVEQTIEDETPAEPELITAKIQHSACDGITFEYVEDMTWGEFVNSEYNEDGAFFTMSDDDRIFAKCCGSTVVYIGTSEDIFSDVKLTDKITPVSEAGFYAFDFIQD